METGDNRRTLTVDKKAKPSPKRKLKARSAAEKPVEKVPKEKTSMIKIPMSASHEELSPWDLALQTQSLKGNEVPKIEKKIAFRKEKFLPVLPEKPTAHSPDFVKPSLPPKPPKTTPEKTKISDGVRLSKIMSERGLCSRREADLWIERGWVLVNGELLSELGTRIDPSADIEILAAARQTQALQVTFLLNKPVGYVSGQAEDGHIPAAELLAPANQFPQKGDPVFADWMLKGLAPAGRLDADSSGLLVFTQDGRVAKKLIGEDSKVEKEYLVRVSGEMIEGGLELLRHGLSLDGTALKTAWVKQLNEDQLHFILREGKKRQIRRMCEQVGLRVLGLKRVRIGKIMLGGLALGQWRFLRQDESF